MTYFTQGFDQANISPSEKTYSRFFGMLDVAGALKMYGELVVGFDGPEYENCQRPIETVFCGRDGITKVLIGEKLYPVSFEGGNLSVRLYDFRKLGRLAEHIGEDVEADYGGQIVRGVIESVSQKGMVFRLNMTEVTLPGGEKTPNRTLHEILTLQEEIPTLRSVKLMGNGSAGKLLYQMIGQEDELLAGLVGTLKKRNGFENSE